MGEGGWWDGVELHTWLVVHTWNMQVRLGRLCVRDVYVVTGGSDEDNDMLRQ